MAATLSPFTGEWASESNFISHATVSAPTNRKLEPLGRHFLAHARRKRHQRTFSEDDRIEASKNVKNVEDEDDGEISEAEDPMMLSRDPKDWKNQDHYAVLGLSKYRYKATDEQIKKAHRKKVLKHHPDKKAAVSGGQGQDDGFFKCIQKAMEILSDPVKRRQYDSVDENADVEPPSKKAKGSFYKNWAPVFAAEARFSKKQPVPQLGDEKSTKEEVDNFYTFWYNFDSWRSFEYQDEDLPDDGESRDQKRHTERKNKAARQKKKSEDIARLRELVDEALSLDPRIKIFKEEEKKRRNAKKNAREAEEKRLLEEKRIAEEAAAKKKAEEEEASKNAAADAKKAKEAAKQAVKKNRRVLKGSVKDANYFVESPSADQISKTLDDVELIQSKVDPSELAELVEKLKISKEKEEVKKVYVDSAKALVEAGKAKAEEFKILLA